MLGRREFLRFAAALPIAAGTSAASASMTRLVPEGEFVRLGGIDQWIAILPASRDAPFLLFLHGGPGEALSPFAEVVAPWQRAFNVVLWDQRGSGRTFGRNRGHQGTMTLAALAADAIELAELVRKRTGRHKIAIAGQSWGSILGWTAAQARPDLFSAYVGTGQAVSWRRAIPAQEAYARAQAEAAGDKDALTALDAARMLPISDPRRTGPVRRWIMPPSDEAFIDLQRRTLGPPSAPKTGAVADWVEGFGFSADALTPFVTAFDAYESGPSIKIPAVIVQGEEDRITPTSIVEKFVSDLKAPLKSFVTVPGGHFACYMKAHEFADALAAQVLPLVR